MLFLYISLGVVGLLLIVLFISLLVIYKYTFYTPLKGQNNDYDLANSVKGKHDQNKVKSMIKVLSEIPYEDAYVTSFDKLKLHARVYKNPDSDSVCIMCHGYRGTAFRDFSGGGMDMIKRGYNVILIDERGHGLSEGHTITFGRREQRDLLSWIEYAKKTFGNEKKLVLVGISMGGATVLLASDKVDAGVKIIADCPYTTEKEIICETIKSILHLSPRFFWPLVNLSSIIFGHTNLKGEDAKEHIRNSKADILIIHGDSDSIVPHRFSYAAYEMFPDKIQYELFPGADHGVSYLEDKERYQKVISDFLAK